MAAPLFCLIPCECRESAKINFVPLSTDHRPLITCRQRLLYACSVRVTRSELPDAEQEMTNGRLVVFRSFKSACP